MGLLDEIKNASERSRILESLTVKQLRALATQFGVDVKPKGGLGSILIDGGQEGKELLVARLNADTSNLPFEKLKVWVSDQREATVKPREAPAAIAVTPTIAPTRSAPMVSFDEVYAYLDAYRFISRYQDERSYELELAGALRERFGTVMRQLPVPGVVNENKRTKSIDLDVGGIGIELKYDLSPKEWVDTLSQIESYRTHYGEKLIVLLISTAFSQQEHALRELAHIITK